MGMTPTEFFESFVEGNMEDCIENPGCIRRAMNAAVSTSHLADHYFKFNKRHAPDQVGAFSEIGKFVDHLGKQTDGAFTDIRSIANAYKHLYTDSEEGPSAYATVNSAGSIESIELNDDENLKGMKEEYVEGSEPYSGRSCVVFTRRDGSCAEFLPVLKATVNYWHDTIFRHT